MFYFVLFFELIRTKNFQNDRKTRKRYSTIDRSVQLHPQTRDPFDVLVIANYATRFQPMRLSLFVSILWRLWRRAR